MVNVPEMLRPVYHYVLLFIVTYASYLENDCVQDSCQCFLCLHESVLASQVNRIVISAVDKQCDVCLCF